LATKLGNQCWSSVPLCRRVPLGLIIAPRIVTPDSPEVPFEEVCGGMALAGIDRE